VSWKRVHKFSPRLVRRIRAMYLVSLHERSIRTQQVCYSVSQCLLTRVLRTINGGFRKWSRTNKEINCHTAEISKLKHCGNFCVAVTLWSPSANNCIFISLLGFSQAGFLRDMKKIVLGSPSWTCFGNTAVSNQTANWMVQGQISARAAKQTSACLIMLTDSF